jgi:hypothetical protein
MILKSVVPIAKNYLVEKEFETLERVVSMYPDYAEDRTAGHIPIDVRHLVPHRNEAPVMEQAVRKRGRVMHCRKENSLLLKFLSIVA